MPPTPALISADIYLLYLKNKDKITIPSNKLLQPAAERHDSGQEEEETEVEEQCNGPEITEQSALNCFNSTLQNALECATKAEHGNPRKRPTRYDGKSKRTLKRRKKHQEDLAKQGYLSVFKFTAYVKEKNKTIHMDQLVEKPLESKQVMEENAIEVLDSEESIIEVIEVSEDGDCEVLDTEILVPRCMGPDHQVRCTELLML